MIILQTNTIAMQLQKNKGHFIIADVNSFFFLLFGLDCTKIPFVYYRWIEVSAVNVGMTFKIVPSSANMK